MLYYRRPASVSEQRPFLTPSRKIPHLREREFLWSALLMMQSAKRFRTNFAAGRGRSYEEVLDVLEALLEGVSRDERSIEDDDPKTSR